MACLPQIARKAGFWNMMPFLKGFAQSRMESAIVQAMLEYIGAVCKAKMKSRTFKRQAVFFIVMKINPGLKHRYWRG